MLAYILHHLVPEFKKVSRTDIEEKYIVGTPEVGTVPVGPGKTNLPSSIRGAGTEQGETNEGYITFDILFYAKLPISGETVTFIINLEAQKDMPKEYPLMKRVIYYGARLLSSQKERDFSGMDFGNIRKVYTIWLCFEPPKGHDNAINSYTLAEKRILGDYKAEPENYALLNAIVVYLGSKQTGNKLLGMLYLIFKAELNAKDKKSRLKAEYELDMNDEMQGELNIMCNLSEGIYERGISQGLSQGKEEGRGEMILNMLKDHEPIDKITKYSGWAEAQVRELAEKHHIVIA